MGLLENKAGLVTAAGSGIGRASAMALAKEGAKVMVSDINEESGKETVRLIEEAGGSASFFKCNVAIEEEVKGLVEATVAKFGKLDFAHNNAGMGPKPVPIAESPSEDFDRVIKINLYGMYYALKYEIIEMLKTGGGSIVNTSSGSGLEGMTNIVPYSASKWGVTGMTKSVALEYGKENIRVNAIAPGLTLTPQVEAWFEAAPEQAKATLGNIPSGKATKPEDQANAVVFLCSDLASQINGVILPVDGGFVAGKLH
ncbi:glucose 1-dehydrogenase [Paenibacillus barcinonensis]|uniref:Glucose 1-dehydrogenase n=1 Tax=Paenibacillus barcinonensis TaxID=198119 RepID=A0A2V4VAR7_PAEBA|nr:glucose 1-dehydrogenase [Paenibacillus barcinonensis]PYE43262.1 NAD(P)-dependent dehydrogenase (short-subunit alcohol dehydrogenase family) [Paenibacillus barcinonensis]QKS55604.1 glucose 1-dehydrogenase [Paenibacillus barcinonensis]